MATYRWDEVQLACLPPIPQATLIRHGDTGPMYLGTVEQQKDGRWRVISHVSLKRNVYETEDEAKRAVQAFWGLSDDRISGW